MQEKEGAFFVKKWIMVSFHEYLFSIFFVKRGASTKSPNCDICFCYTVMLRTGQWGQKQVHTYLNGYVQCECIIRYTLSNNDNFDELFPVFCVSSAACLRTFSMHKQARNVHYPRSLVTKKMTSCHLDSFKNVATADVVEKVIVLHR